MSNVPVRVERGRQSPDDVDRILRALPDWFGIEDSIKQYVADAATLPTYLAYVPGTDECAGILLTSRHFPEAADVHLMAVAPQWHGRGVGRRLLRVAENDLAADGVRFLQVKTQGPSSNDAHYARTQAFYQSQGFTPLEEIHGLWPGNPCLILVKSLTKLELREITDANRAEIETMTVAPHQDDYVSDVTGSFAEAAEYPDACPRWWGVYADDNPVGFVMISDNIPPERSDYLGPYFLWKLLIDQRYQHLRYGSRVIDQVIDYIQTRPNDETLLVSYVPGEHTPRDFYRKYGFQETDRIHEGEPVLTLEL